MVNGAFRLSSTWESFTTECDRPKLMFTNLKYPLSLLNSIISHFVTSAMSLDPDVPTRLPDKILFSEGQLENELDSGLD